ncbi:hypothetical protein BDN72DRAFT_51972 [Pluteus cervinus]|uniref:Uncharacterized protein n=1 Tax=Pluteus cervinus TaxID=181527 RepID=A0ACD3B8H1_9AGAR|nr:hypothetical protein BDN72DRAFT_51972 [Pluteus cervinus]
MYRSSSPYAPERQQQQQYQAQPASSAGNQIAPGTITYTTSQGPDGRTIYHPFKAVPASYQTPSGLVTGIQWIPAEATQVLPVGATPANSEFAASWNRGTLSKEDQKALEKWQREEEKRRKKEEKESKRIREKEHKNEARYDDARHKDAAAAAARERRRSFNAGAAAPFPGGYPIAAQPAAPSYPGAAATTYAPTSPGPTSPAYPSSPYKAYTSLGNASGPAPGGYPASATTSPYMRDRRPSVNATEIEKQMANVAIRGSYSPNTAPSALPRPQKYGGGDQQRPVSSYTTPYTAPSGYPAAGGYPTSSSTGSTYPQSPYMGHSPNIRPAEIAPYPGANYSSSPAVRPDGIPGSPQVYPRGHILEGQPLPPRSRATTPNPGAPPGAVGVGYPQAQVPVTFPSSPKMQDGQLVPPEGFTRPPNNALPYTFFDQVKIINMEEILQAAPRMPGILLSHDVQEDDWSRFTHDLYLAWGGRLPVPEYSRSGQAPKNSKVSADLVDLWNGSFFANRGLEVVLYRGREIRTGPRAGQTDSQRLDDDDESSEESSSESETESSSEDEVTHGGKYPPFAGNPPGQYGAYGGYGGNAGYEAAEVKRKKKEERRKRRKEKRARRKARKQKKKQYALYIRCSRGGPGGY